MLIKFFLFLKIFNFLVLIRKLCMNSIFFGSYIWCGVTATLKNVFSSYAFIIVCLFIVLFFVYFCKNIFGKFNLFFCFLLILFLLNCVEGDDDITYFVISCFLYVVIMFSVFMWFIVLYSLCLWYGLISVVMCYMYFVFLNVWLMLLGFVRLFWNYMMWLLFLVLFGFGVMLNVIMCLVLCLMSILIRWWLMKFMLLVMMYCLGMGGKVVGMDFFDFVIARGE